MADGLLITGATGQVGQELVRALAGMGEVHAPGRDELDLTDADSIRAAVRRLRPRWIVNAAAYTAVDRAEEDSAQAYAINAEAVGVLGEEAAAIGAAVLHFSTDYVFAGEGSTAYAEDDATGPMSIYGASKLAGEQALATSGAAHIVLRTSWVYGATGKNFLLTVVRVARERDEMKIVADQHGSPTWARELARAAAAVMQFCDAKTGFAGSIRAAVRPVSGVYHAVCAGETTWFGFAEEALRLRRLAEPAARFATLLPVLASEYPTPARRPHNSRLSCEKLERVFGVRLMDWRDALQQVSGEIEPVVPVA